MGISPVKGDCDMALNPQLLPNGLPVPFVNEMFVLARDGVEFEIDKIPGSNHVKARGTIYLSNIRMVFVANKPMGIFGAFDMPLVCALLLRLYSWIFLPSFAWLSVKSLMHLICQ
ncbi:hypothetical protein LINGRAHAP2_LOCUS7690 [Linum grandiflorum]